MTCNRVFSAQAEVFPTAHGVGTGLGCFLRASGGVSIGSCNSFKRFGFSPRKRRCFDYRERQHGLGFVFSAQAEVFLRRNTSFCSERSFLRASGGVSPCKAPPGKVILFSPRKRRCFLIPKIQRQRDGVFSAQAEVFLRVNVRGGVK